MDLTMGIAARIRGSKSDRSRSIDPAHQGAPAHRLRPERYARFRIVVKILTKQFRLSKNQPELLRRLESETRREELKASVLRERKEVTDMADGLALSKGGIRDGFYTVASLPELSPGAKRIRAAIDAAAPLVPVDRAHADAPRDMQKRLVVEDAGLKSIGITD